MSSSLTFESPNSEFYLEISNLPLQMDEILRAKDHHSDYRKDENMDSLLAGEQTNYFKT